MAFKNVSTAPRIYLAQQAHEFLRQFDQLWCGVQKMASANLQKLQHVRQSYTKVMYYWIPALPREFWEAGGFKQKTNWSIEPNPEKIKMIDRFNWQHNPCELSRLIKVQLLTRTQQLHFREKNRVQCSLQPLDLVLGLWDNMGLHPAKQKQWCTLKLIYHSWGADWEVLPLVWAFGQESSHLR